MKKTILRILLSCFLIITVLSASCTRDTGAQSTSTSTETTTATYRIADTLFTAPEGYEVESYYLTVPEDHGKPDGKTIDIYFAIFRTKAAVAKPDPIVYLAGGPGEHATDATSLMFNSRYAPLMKNRDLIIVDQRGTGYSKPSLDCPEITDLYYKYLNSDSRNDDSRAIQLETLKDCYDRFISEGIDLSTYNSAQNAADLNDLRIALGYREWNLLGISYGTRLALTMLRDHPQGIRSVILCSSYPLQADLYTETPKNINRALDVLFSACAENPESNAAYPDLENRFYTIVRNLNDAPVTIEVMHPFTGEQYDVLVNGDSLVDTVITALYSTEVLPLIPKVITDAGEGKFDTLGLLMSSDFVNIELVSLGMHYSVQSSEELPFVDPEKVQAAIAEFPRMKDFLENNFSTDGDIFSVYDFWHKGEADPVENEPVSSDVPALIISGEYDPITPPEWGEMVSENLKNSYFFKVPGTGHDTIFSPDPCILNTALDFLDDPETGPDSTCVQQLGEPDFVTPNVDMVPFTSSIYGFTGVYPEGWTEVYEGAYQRTDLGITAIVEQSAGPNISKEVLLGQLINMLGLDADLLPTEEFMANDLEWSVYQVEVQTLSTDLAIAEKDGICYFVLFSCVPDDHDIYYNQLVIPAVKSLAPLN